MVNWYVWTRALFAAFGGFTFGYDLGAINGVKDMVGFRQTFNLSSDQGGNGSGSMCDDDVGSSAILGLIVAVLSIGCFVGALLAGAFSDFAGRKVAIIVGGVLYAVGGLLQTAAVFLWMMFLGRVIGGLGVGILYVVVPVYIAEISPKKLRGTLVSFNSIALTSGFLVAQIVNLICERFIFGWRISLSLQILIGSIIAFGMLFLPETPRWLVKKHKEKKAAKVLARIYQTDEKGIEKELSGIDATVVNTEKGHFWQRLKMFCSWKFIQRVVLGMWLQFFNRAAGSTSIGYYSVSIFCKVGVPGYIASVVIGVVVIVATVCTIFTIDKFGRKVLLLLGCLGMLFSTATAATLILVFRLEEGGSTAVGYIVVALVCSFLFAYACGWGPVTWVINAEIHPLEVRGVAVSLTSSTYWMGNSIFAQVTPILLALIQTSGTFYLFVGVNIAGILFTLLTLPETKGETLERVDLLFSKPWLERINLVYYLRCGCLCFCSKQRRTAYRVGDSGEDSKKHDILSNGVSNILAVKSDKEDELEDAVSDTCKYPDYQEYLVQYLTPL